MLRGAGAPSQQDEPQNDVSSRSARNDTGGAYGSERHRRQSETHAMFVSEPAEIKTGNFGNFGDGPISNFGDSAFFCAHSE